MEQTQKNIISVVIPVYNEETSVLSTIKQVKEVMDRSNQEYEIIAVNDGSKDRSKEILEQIKNIQVINHPYNIGYGASLKTGIKKSKGNYILITDADGTYPIADIPRLLKHLNNYDMVVGARTGKNVKIPLLRRPAKKIINIIANFMSGHKIPDLNSGFRLFKKDLCLEFFHLYPQKFSFTTTITLAFLTSGYSVKYIPTDYFNRKGTSSISPVKDFVGFINLIIRITTYFNPFKIFFSLSLLLLILAIIIFFYTSIMLGRIMDTTVMVVFLSSLQIFLFGIIADLIVKTRK
jgi:polyisoprenyl-phosphate glycosyltransferase